MKFFALPLAVLLLQDAESLEIVSKHKHKKAFVEKVKAARNNLGDVSRRLSGNDRLIAKSIHTPGLRSEQRTAQSTSASASVPKAKTNDPTSKLEADESARQLKWWNWWKSSANATEGEELAEEAECEGEDCNMYDNNNQSSGTWWSNYGWNNWNTQEDDIWSDGTNTSYVTESLRDFSIKYSGCRSLASFMTVEDASETSPLITQNFATYRLCPSESCSDDSWKGCKSVYGEYMMSVEDFLTIQEDYLLEAFEQQCEYCENCMYFETWYSGKYYNNDEDRKLNNEDHACAAYDVCYDYEDYCSDEAQKEAEEESGINLEEFFGCEKVQFDISSNNGNNNNNNNNNGEEDEQDNGDEEETIEFDDQFSTGMYEMISENDGVAYIGTHCLDGEITLGLFADENCAQYIGNKIGSYNETESIAEIATVVEMYIPQGCMGCDENNLVSSNYYVPDGDKETEEYQEAYENGFEDYVSDICSNMYLESAKCHSHLSEDDMSLELSDSELEIQELTCNFIEDVVKGYVSEDGLVNSHENQGNFIGDFFQAFGGDYNGDPEGRMTGAQVAALFLTGAASVAMGAAAYHLKTKVDAGLSDGLIANDAAVST